MYINKILVKLYEDLNNSCILHTTVIKCVQIYIIKSFPRIKCTDLDLLTRNIIKDAT